MDDAGQFGLLFQLIHRGADARGAQSILAALSLMPNRWFTPGTLYVGLFAELLHGRMFCHNIGYHSQASQDLVHTVQLFIEGNLLIIVSSVLPFCVSS